MKSKAVFLLIAMLVGPAALPERIQAADPNESPDAVAARQLAEQRLGVLRRAAASYEIRVGPNGATEAVLRPEPVLHWANQVRYSLDGATFIWTAGGRPHAMASFYSSTDEKNFRLLDHEFQSLSPGPLVAQRNGARVWAPTEPGVAMKPFPDAPAPAKTAALRLVQMRRLANEFTAIGFPYDSRSEDQWQLRLMPQPLYRYEVEEGELIDGALFAFAHGTDPDVIVVLEAGAGPESKWSYGLGRMCGLPLEVRLRDELIWKVPLCSVSSRPDPSLLYLTFYRRPIER
ncbi:MAG: hypothetical protein GXX96_24050 [Planctomycetaceae bacterium]|nr:hypothetical protein [Planctomycetaceae bacterium]